MIILRTILMDGFLYKRNRRKTAPLKGQMKGGFVSKWITIFLRIRKPTTEVGGSSLEQRHGHQRHPVGLHDIENVTIRPPRNRPHISGSIPRTALLLDAETERRQGLPVKISHLFGAHRGAVGKVALAGANVLRVGGLGKIGCRRRGLLAKRIRLDGGGVDTGQSVGLLLTIWRSRECLVQPARIVDDGRLSRALPEISSTSARLCLQTWPDPRKTSAAVG